jgi:hypothetical protein
MHGFQSAWTRRGHAWPRTEAGCRLGWGITRVNANACRANFQPGQSASSIDNIDGRSGKSGQLALARNSSSSCRRSLVCSVGRYVGSMCAKSLHDTRPSGHGNTGAPPCAGTRSCCGAGGSSLMGPSRRGGGHVPLRGELMLMDIESAICIYMGVAWALHVRTESQHGSAQRARAALCVEGECYEYLAVGLSISRLSEDYCN